MPAKPLPDQGVPLGIFIIAAKAFLEACRTHYAPVEKLNRALRDLTGRSPVPNADTIAAIEKLGEEAAHALANPPPPGSLLDHIDGAEWAEALTDAQASYDPAGVLNGPVRKLLGEAEEKVNRLIRPPGTPSRTDRRDYEGDAPRPVPQPPYLEPIPPQPREPVKVHMNDGTARRVDLSEAAGWGWKPECQGAPPDRLRGYDFLCFRVDGPFRAFYLLRAVYNLGDLWVAEGNNPDAVLATAYRQRDSAYVETLFEACGNPLPPELMGIAQRREGTIGEHLSYLGRDPSSTKVFHDLIKSRAIEGGPIPEPGRKRGDWWMRVLDPGEAFKKGGNQIGPDSD